MIITTESFIESLTTRTRELTNYITLQLTEGKILNSQEVRGTKSI